jgi:hypothetical protein
VKLPRSPIAAKPAAGKVKPSGPAHTRMAPPAHKAPQPNPTVEPLQRRSSGAPRSSQRIESDRMTMPKSPSQARPTAGPAPAKTAPPDRREAPQRNHTLQQPKSRSSGVEEETSVRDPKSGGSRPQFRDR